MSGIPSREGLTALKQAVEDIIPGVIVGVSRLRDDGQAQVVYSFRFGIGAYTVPVGELPEGLKPTASRSAHADPISAATQKVIEWQANFAGARQLLSFPILGDDTSARVWVGVAEPGPIASQILSGLQEVADRAHAILESRLTPADHARRLERLDLTAGLLPALMPVLDIREVFDPLSEISKKALPHDMLTLGLYNDDLTELTMHARSGKGPDLGGTFPQPYPPAVVRARVFDILEARSDHPLERDRPSTILGNQSSIRVHIRLGDRVIGGLGFMSHQPGIYTTADVEIAQRLCDYVAVALSHQRLAEQAQHNEEFRARAARFELLDDLLSTLAGTGDLREIFNRISVIVQKVLPYDAAWLPIRLPNDGTKARIHASFGFTMPVPDIVNVPDHLIDNPDWEHEIVEDLGARTERYHLLWVERGYRSLLRVPVRLEGRFGGALVMFAKKPFAFAAPDMLAARRIADRLALLVSRDREVAASQRADEASVRASKLEARVKALTEELDARTGARRVVGDSTEWRGVLKHATQVAPNDTTVLLLGESGTGKEVVARFVHRASPRANGPFIALNCAALPEQLLEAELFGYERGAYTGAVQSKPGQLEQAAGGTLFLDEVGEMSLPAQAKFLRVLQEREFQRLGGTRVLKSDARIIAATNRDLERAITQNQFREDLYYRLNVFAIVLPPLRDRRLDILPLSDALLAEIGRTMGRPAAGISREARDRLLEYRWPGNVRELRNILERASILCDGGLITPEHLAILPGARPASPVPAREIVEVVAPKKPEAPVTSAGELKSLERDMIERALASVRFNKSRAAKSLGLTRQQLYLRMKKYGLE